MPLIVGAVTVPPTIGIVIAPFPTLAGPIGVTVMPRELRNAEICVDARTVAWPPVTCSLFAWAGTAVANRDTPAASAPTALFDSRDI